MAWMGVRCLHCWRNHTVALNPWSLWTALSRPVLVLKKMDVVIPLLFALTVWQLEMFVPQLMIFPLTLMSSAKVSTFLGLITPGLPKINTCEWLGYTYWQTQCLNYSPLNRGSMHDDWRWWRQVQHWAPCFWVSRWTWAFEGAAGLCVLGGDSTAYLQTCGN